MNKLLPTAILSALAFISPFDQTSHNTAVAMWAKYTDAQLVQSSELIVIGEMIGQTQVTLTKEIKLNIGVLQVKEVLKGDKQKTSVVFLQLPTSGKMRSSTDISYKKGQKGLWFLRSRPETKGIYLADHPQRFISMEAQQQIRNFRQLTSK